MNLNKYSFSSVKSGGTGSSNAGTGGSGSGKRSMHSSTGGTGSSASAEATGKPGITKQMNMFLRTKSDSGKRLSDAVSYKPFYRSGIRTEYFSFNRNLSYNLCIH